MAHPKRSKAAAPAGQDVGRLAEKVRRFAAQNAPPILFERSKRMRRARWKKKSRRGLWDAYDPTAPQKRGLNSPRIWMVSAACTARRASGRCCRPQQPTARLRLKGFPQPLAAAAWQLKECQSPEIRPRPGAPLWVRCSGYEPPIEHRVYANANRAAASEAKP